MFCTFKYLHYLAFFFFFCFIKAVGYIKYKICTHMYVCIYTKAQLGFVGVAKFYHIFQTLRFLNIPPTPFPCILIMPVLNFSTDLVGVCSSCCVLYGRNQWPFSEMQPGVYFMFSRLSNMLSEVSA